MSSLFFHKDHMERVPEAEDRQGEITKMQELRSEVHIEAKSLGLMISCLSWQRGSGQKGFCAALFCSHQLPHRPGVNRLQIEFHQDDLTELP